MKNNQTTVIVTGNVRSGTSAMMRTLHNAGINVLFDDEKRPPDPSNPNGYFEYPEVASLKSCNDSLNELRESAKNYKIFSLENGSSGEAYNFLSRRIEQLSKINWLDNIAGGAIKILPNSLLKNLPLDRKYAVIFMRRDFLEVAESYYSYIKNRPNQSQIKQLQLSKEEFAKEWSEVFSKNAEEAYDFLKSHPENFSIIEVEMHKINEQIQDVSKFVSEHLGREINLIVPPKNV